MSNIYIPGYVKFWAFIAILVIIYYARSYWDQHQVEAESARLAVQAVDSVTATWSEADFKKFEDAYQNTYLVNSVQKANLKQALAVYSMLGKRTSDADCALQNFTTYKNEKENYVAANYLCQVQYQNAPAQIIAAVRRFQVGGAWKITYFDVTSTYLRKK